MTGNNATKRVVDCPACHAPQVDAQDAQRPLLHRSLNSLAGVAGAFLGQAREPKCRGLALQLLEEMSCTHQVGLLVGGDLAPSLCSFLAAANVPLEGERGVVFWGQHVDFQEKPWNSVQSKSHHACPSHEQPHRSPARPGLEKAFRPFFWLCSLKSVLQHDVTVP